ncbi:GPI transamidase component [Xylographa opegraphella]|nr:GPI transamidase component [Xylographa opegraphella]
MADTTIVSATPEPPEDATKREESLAAVKVSTASKKPPPETAHDIRIRTLVITSFWVTVVLFGLPVWWWTTSIHRSRLPLHEMLEWADGKACKPTFPLQIIVDAPSLSENEAQHLVRATQHALDDLNEFSAHHLRLNLFESLTISNHSLTDQYQEGSDHNCLQGKSGRPEESALTVMLKQVDGAGAISAELQPHSSILNIFYPANQAGSTSSSSSALANTIASKLQDIFAEEQASIAYALIANQPHANGQVSSTSGSGQMSPSSPSNSSIREQRSSISRTLSPELADKLGRRTTRSLKYAPTYHITISLFTPTSAPSSWDIESAIDEYLAPLLASFSISNFTVDTQVQLYATFSPSIQQPEHNSELGIWTLRKEDLSGFVNAAEWPLSPSIGEGPTLNFILYVPSEQMSPLMVKDSHVTSWLVPQWGGITIFNPSSEVEISRSRSSLSKEAIRPALLTFSHQLLSLLGAPESPSSFPLQLQTLTRVRAASLLLSASSTMGSLARLTVALPSIAIPKNVAIAVDTTLTHLRATCLSLTEGRFNDALEHARIAEAEAEKGFFDKSMVGQVYFPDEHKVAVYLPLLGPIGVPLVMSALKEIRRYWKVWRGRRTGR